MPGNGEGQDSEDKQLDEPGPDPVRDPVVPHLDFSSAGGRIQLRILAAAVRL